MKTSNIELGDWVVFNDNPNSKVYLVVGFQDEHHQQILLNGMPVDTPASCLTIVQKNNKPTSSGV